ncbi:MAG: Hsp20/alpha crystallin family protein [Candidatus Methanomethylicus sp.]|nr:Hsp20/alpha crystallin family protein [Candidatus Methanomethylicus sp.]
MPYRNQDLWDDFDRIFENFRNGFEDLLVPYWAELPVMPAIEARMPLVNLEDRGKGYLLTAEIPSFKKEDVELQVVDNSIEISASVGWKYDEKSKECICSERRCNSFYRRVDLPEKRNPDDVKAELRDGVLEITLPKNEPIEKKKVALK